MWLIATAGLLVGCFPDLEGSLLSGQSAVVVALLLGWVVRDMGLWLRGRVAGRAGPVWRVLCDGALVCGSWTVALCWGWLLGGLLSGVPERPASGAVALLSAGAAVLFAAHGMGFAAVRLTGRPYERARRLVGRGGRPWQSFALTAVLMAALPVLAGLSLPLTESVADGASLRLLLPVVLVITPLMAAVQLWTWAAFRHRVTHPSYL